MELASADIGLAGNNPLRPALAVVHGQLTSQHSDGMEAGVGVPPAGLPRLVDLGDDGHVAGPSQDDAGVDCRHVRVPGGDEALGDEGAAAMLAEAAAGYEALGMPLHRAQVEAR